MKISFAEYKNFINDEAWWDESIYVDDGSYLKQTGQQIRELTAEQMQVIPPYWQVVLDGRVRVKDLTKDNKHQIGFQGLSLAAFYQRWHKKQVEQVVAIRIPKDAISSLMRMLEGLGGKIL